MRIFRLLLDVSTGDEFRNLRLLMVGKAPTHEMLILKKELFPEANLAEEKIVFLENLADEQLCALYSSAKALIFPSLKEGLLAYFRSSGLWMSRHYE